MLFIDTHSQNATFAFKFAFLFSVLSPMFSENSNKVDSDTRISG